MKPGEKRDPERIDRLLKLIGKVWRDVDDQQRLIQLLITATSERDELRLYNLEDDELERRLAAFGWYYGSRDPDLYE